MNRQTISVTIGRHGVVPGSRNPFSNTVAGADTVLTDFQSRLLHDSAPIRIASAPTGSGKTYAFELAPLIGKNVLFVVPTRRLAQNLEQSASAIMQRNGWTGEEIEGRLAVWTSDAMEDAIASGSTSGDVRSGRVRQLRGTDMFRKDGTFIIATPESIGRLLLNPPPRDSGQPAMSLKDLLSRDHIVFDEFHTIQAQGFGLACALCRMASGLSVAGHRPHVTFLSATPVDITGALIGFDIDETEISMFEEQVESWRIGAEPEGARIVHGDVRLSLGHHMDILNACRGESEAIAEALSNGRAVVVIFDSVAKLKAARGDLSEIFKGHGVEEDRILTINSIDDAHHLFRDSHGTGGRSANPLDACVILATSSVEIGVTFNASMMIMDPGHDSCSFIQRVGRVSRGDLAGRIIVAGSIEPRQLRSFRSLGGVDRSVGKPVRVDVREFTNAVLRDVAREFSYPEFPNAEDAGNVQLQTHGRMSNRAVWCACLFWSALRRVWTNHSGERTTLRAFQPRKARFFEHKLITLENSDFERTKTWAKAFMDEAVRFRDIEPRIRVRYRDRIDHVPESMFGRYREISRSPLLEDREGIYIEISRPLESILKTGDTRNFQPSVQPMAPLDGLSIPSLPRRSASRDLVHILKNTRRHPFGQDGDMVLNYVIELVTMTGVFPREDEEVFTTTHQGTAVM